MEENSYEPPAESCRGLGMEFKDFEVYICLFSILAFGCTTLGQQQLAGLLIILRCEMVVIPVKGIACELEKEITGTPNKGSG